MAQIITAVIELFSAKLYARLQCR